MSYKNKSEAVEFALEILRSYADELKRNIGRTLQELDDPQFEKDKDKNLEFLKEKRTELKLLWEGIKEISLRK
jgi:hypothetical protein